MNKHITVDSPFTHFKKVQVDEHLVDIPQPPIRPIKIKSFFGGDQVIPLDDLIMYRHLSADDAYWKRDKFEGSQLPQFFYDYIPDITLINQDRTIYDQRRRLTHLSVEDTNTLIYLFDREMFRRVHGVHFKNGEDIEYLTGDHYFILMWMKMYAIDEQDATDKDYGKYFEFQRDFLYCVMHAINDPNILGVDCAKPKKTGITQVMAGVFLNRSSVTRMAQMGIMSKGDDAKKVNMVLFFHGFKGLPPIFKPVVRDWADGKGYIWFGEKEAKNFRTEKAKERMYALLDAEPLDTRVFAAPTKEAAFDAPKMYFIWFDELPKYDTENNQQPEMVFIRNQETIKVQTRITGKCFITSYPPEKDTPGFIQARKIYYNSKLSTIKDNPLGRTASGLICFYISALNSHRDAFNKYGKCDRVKAKWYNDAERNSVKHDKKLYQAKIRQYNETEAECWMSAGAGSTFDNKRLGEIDFDLRAELTTGRPYQDGRIEWKNKLWESGARDKRPTGEFCEVEFIPLTDEQVERGDIDRLRLFHRPSPSEICQALRMGRDRYGNYLLPLPIFNFFGGTDPTEYASGSEVNEGSKNASFTMNFKDPQVDLQYGKIASGILCSAYFFRPDNPEEFYQDLVKEILFFGKRIIVEANKAWVATRLIQDKLGYYMIVRDRKDGLLKPWAPGMDYALIRTGASKEGDEASDHEMIVRSIASFIVKPGLGEVDYAKAGMNDERLLEQLMNFNPKMWKLFDLVMAFGYTLLCGQVMSLTRGSEQVNKYNRTTLGAIFAALAS